MTERDGDWVRIGGKWCHRPWWKVAINTALRAVQPQRHKFVVYTKCVEDDAGDPLLVVGYGFGPIEHASPPAGDRLVARAVTAIQVGAIAAMIWACRRRSER